MFNNINLNLYKDFYLVCKYGSINKAGKRVIYITTGNK